MTKNLTERCQKALKLFSSQSKLAAAMDVAPDTLAPILKGEEPRSKKTLLKIEAYLGGLGL